MSNELVGWRDDFDISEEERVFGFVRQLSPPHGVLRPWRLRVAFEAAPAGPHRLRLEYYLDEEHFKVPLSEPEQEQPLQGLDGEAPAADLGIGTPGPLPDAGPQEGQVVEGVGGEVEEHLGEREAAFFGAIRDAIDDLHFAYSGARASGCAVGTLVRPTKTLGASLNWDGGADLRLSLSASMTHPEDEADRHS